MVTIDLDKSKILEFKVNITGNTSEPMARLLIPLTDGMNLVIPGETYSGSIQVTIPKLKPFYERLVSGPIKLEVLVDGNIFTPWIDQVEFKEPLKVVAEAVVEKQTEKSNKDKVQVGVSLINESTSKSFSSNKKYSKNNIQDDYI